MYCDFAGTSFHEASFRGQADAVLLVLEPEHNADVNAGSENNEMPLHMASLRGEASAQVLLEHGATVNAQNRIRRTRLYQASKRGAVGSSRAVWVLLEHGADLKPPGRRRSDPISSGYRMDMSKLRSCWRKRIGR